ncbi:sugar transferase [Cereibacter sphaeroides]|uniref:sugar transferase n=1 Tax=Cereibacter sphaeroides TaxID=1063 RepID=UPI0011942803|nr:sugar transferase [Cereibacter sphaeroides]GEM94200.1 undecaprenyl-phosphate galactose phosphotransferase WbaP [Cereibacter sphaeroides]
MNANLSPLGPAPAGGALGDLSGFEPVPQGLAAGRSDALARRKLASGVTLLLFDGAPLVAVAQGLSWAGPPFAPDAAFAPLLLQAVLVQIVLKALGGLYPGYGLHPDAALRRSVQAWGGGALVAVSSGWLLMQASAGTLAEVLAAFLLVQLMQLCTGRLGRALLERLGLWGLPVRVTGCPERAAALERFLGENRRYGLLPVRRADEAQVVLWADDALPPPESLAQLRQCHAEVMLVSDLPKLQLSGLQPADHGGSLGLRLCRPADGPSVRLLKRALDLALALPAAVVVLPVVLAAALAIRFIDPGPAFYIQPREGRDGRKIPMLKLRTMYRESERMLQDLLERDPAARAEWQTNFKLRKDPRILPFVGRFLRVSSLDELPQLFNIIRGEMSVVGPRPFPEYHLAAMRPEFRLRRASVVPGLTGLWQISERSEADVALQEQIDGYYLDNRSFWFDLSIIFSTFRAVFRGRGAY